MGDRRHCKTSACRSARNFDLVFVFATWDNVQTSLLFHVFEQLFLYCSLTWYKNAHARGNTRTNKSPPLSTMAGKLVVSVSYGFELPVFVAHCFRTEDKYTRQTRVVVFLPFLQSRLRKLSKLCFFKVQFKPIRFAPIIFHWGVGVLNLKLFVI